MMKILICLLLLMECFVSIKAVCYFNGQEKVVLDFECIKLTCIDDNWTTNNEIKSACSKCELRKGATIRTFDGADHPYNLNYYRYFSILEFVESWTDPSENTYPPLFQIYADFGLHFITDVSFRVTKEVILHVDASNIFVIKIDGYSNFIIDSSNPMEVQDGETAFSTLAWKVNNDECLRIATPYYVCDYCNGTLLECWMNSQAEGFVGGVCGYFSGNWQDDHRGRNGTEHEWSSDPEGDFPLSWSVNATGFSQWEQISTTTVSTTTQPINPCPGDGGKAYTTCEIRLDFCILYLDIIFQCAKAICNVADASAVTEKINYFNSLCKFLRGILFWG